MGAESESAHGERVVMTTCRSHCGGTCLLKVHVKDGVIVKIETDDGEEPQYRACLRGRAYRQRVYSPDRLKYPLKRVGQRGRGEFERVTWDEALHLVAKEIIRVRDTYGPSAIAFINSLGDHHFLNYSGLIERLLVGAGGYSGAWGQVSGQARRIAALSNYGIDGDQSTRDDFLNSRLIIMWGWNPAENHGSYGNPEWYLAQAREAGVRIICVDPRYTDSAATFAHQWIPIRPNTDAAMLIAMAYVIIMENLHDQAFLDNYTIGFDKFKDYVLGKEDGIPKTPVWAENITAVAAATIANLAREYATNKPAALMDARAPGRSAYGEQFHRAAITLAAMTGNIGVHGGNAPAASHGGTFSLVTFLPPICDRMKVVRNPVDDEAPLRKDAIFYKKDKEGRFVTHFHSGGPSSARVNRLLFADAILKGRRGGYPADYKLLYVLNLNYVNQYANSNKIAQALKTLEFIVVQEQFMTATAKFADIVLPVNTFLERNDLAEGGCAPFLGCVNKAIDSVGESKSQYEITTELAARLGISDYADKTEQEWLREVINQSKYIGDYDTFKKEGIHKVKLTQPFVSFEKQISDPMNNPFPTPSGKIEIYSQQLADMNNPLLPPIPKYIEAWESRNDPLSQKYPLQLVTPHAKRRAHSQFDNVPWLRELYPQVVSMNSVDAKVRGIRNGDMVMIFNDRGKMIIPAKVTERIMPGVVEIYQGAWYDPDENGVDRGGCANVLTNDVISPSAAFCSNTALVQVQKA